jgi:hypothetical protein
MSPKDRLGDRRGDLRFEIIGQLWGSLETVERLPLRNVGRGGALVESRVPLSAQSVHGVRLLLGEEPSDVKVRVRHVTPVTTPAGDRYLVGLEFVDLGLPALEQIDRLVASSLGQPAPGTGGLSHG